MAAVPLSVYKTSTGIAVAAVFITVSNTLFTFFGKNSGLEVL